MKSRNTILGLFTAVLVLVSAFGPVSEVYMSTVEAAVEGDVISESQFVKEYKSELAKAKKNYSYTGNGTKYEKRLDIIDDALIGTDLNELMKQSSVSIDKKSFELMCRVVQHEAGYVSYYTKELLAEVIVHRAQDKVFKEDSIWGVLHAKNQFTVIKSSSIDRVKVDGETINACKDALLRSVHPQKVLYFRAGHFFSGYRQYKSSEGTYFSYGR